MQNPWLFPDDRTADCLSAPLPKGYFFFVLPSISTHILFAIPGVHLTQERAVFSGFALDPDLTILRSTFG